MILSGIGNLATADALDKAILPSISVRHGRVGEINTSTVERENVARVGNAKESG
jgi:hypothetical protein